LQIRAFFQSSSMLSWFEGDLETAVSELRQAVAIAEEVGDQALLVEGHMRMVVPLYNLGELDEAERLLERCAALASEAGNLRAEAIVAFQLGLVKYHLGELEEAERQALQARDWLDRTGERYFRL